MQVDSTGTTHGSLIVVEGVDGAGKTTLAQALVSQLQESGLPAIYLSFPGREPGTLGAEVYDLHHHGKKRGIEEIHPASLQLLHIAAHIDAIETKIIPALKKGIHVVLDRYWWSTWVYGIVDGVSTESLKAMIEVEKKFWGCVRPAIAYLILRKSTPESRRGDDWKNQISEYRRLTRSERNNHPVRTLSNDGTISAALGKMVAHLPRSDIRRSLSSARRNGSRETQLELGNSSPPTAPMQLFSRLAPAKTTPVFDTYWRFACERQRIFFARIEGKPWPWTKDPILLEYKFTNAYRASDRVSQYLIREVIYRGDPSPEEVFFRTLLFKLFNRIETWELLRGTLGEIAFEKFSFKKYDTILNAAMGRGDRVYSAAYIMPSAGSKNPGGRKHAMHLRLLERMMKDKLPAKIEKARSMAQAFELIRAYPSIGDFLAYQYVTDLNYSRITSFSEMEFVVPGPGAYSGIHKCFSDLGGLTEGEIIKVVTERQEDEFERLGLSFRTLWGRPLQLIDCQNLFCEVDKYARVMHPEFNGRSGRTRIKQRFSADPTPISFWYPPKWGLNELIEKGGAHV